MTGGGPVVKGIRRSLNADSTLLAKPFSRLQLISKVQEALRGGESSDDAN